MRFIGPVLALLVAAVTAQQNAIDIPTGGLDIVANKPLTITWTNPSSGTITIKLQQGSEVTPQTGLVVASGIEAALETATFQIPGNQVNTAQYNFEIIDDTDPSNYNFSPAFSIAGATGEGLATIHSSSVTLSTSGMSRTSSLPSLSTTNSFSFTMTSGTSSMPAMSSATPSMTSQAAQTTIADSNSNGAAAVGVQGSLLAFMLGAIAII